MWTDGEENLAASIAEELGIHHAYAPSSAPGKWQRRIGDASVGVGCAALSRWPISASEVRRLPAGDEPDEGRTVLYARSDAPHAVVPFFVTHLNSGWGQSELHKEQVGTVARFVREKPQDGHPPVLAGDLNAPPDADEVRCLVGKAPPPVRGFVLADAWGYARSLKPGWTWDRRNPHVAVTFEPDARIDYVFVGPSSNEGVGQVLDAELFGTGLVGGVWASDHSGVLAVLRGGPGHADRV